jgi:hypothetical protein
VQALLDAGCNLNHVQLPGTVILELQKGVKGEGGETPKSGDDIGDVVAEDYGVLRAELCEHVVTQDGDASLCDGQSADASAPLVYDVKRAQRLGCTIVGADLLAAVDVSGINLGSIGQLHDKRQPRQLMHLYFSLFDKKQARAAAFVFPEEILPRFVRFVVIFGIVFDLVKEERNLFVAQTAHKLRLTQVMKLLPHDELN